MSPSTSMVDLLYKRNSQTKRKQRLVRLLVGTFVGISVFSVAFFLLWQIGFWDFSKKPKEEASLINIEDLPLIRANPEPYTISPQNPGGMKILHQDKEIYQRVKEAKNKQKSSKELQQVTVLLPTPELPLGMEEEENKETWEETFKKLVDTEIDEIESFDKKNKRAVTEVLDKAYYLQVGKLGSRDEVYQEWRRLSLHHGEKLNGISLSIIPVPQSSSMEGEFQLFLGRFMDRENAETFCLMLQKEGVPCRMFYKGGNA